MCHSSPYQERTELLARASADGDALRQARAQLSGELMKMQAVAAQYDGERQSLRAELRATDEDRDKALAVLQQVRI
jgi:hypothetical protein